MRARRLSLIGVAVGAILLVGWIVGSQPARLTFVVPDDYTGYLLTRWQCHGGEDLERNAVGAWVEQTIRFDATGTACIAVAIPQSGFVVEGFHFGDGSVAPVIVGGTHRRSGSGQLGDAELVITLASIGIGNGQILGDECSLQKELVARFGLPPRLPGGDCDPIYVLPNPSIPLTPGMPSGPG